MTLTEVLKGPKDSDSLYEGFVAWRIRMTRSSRS